MARQNYHHLNIIQNLRPFHSETWGVIKPTGPKKHKGVFKTQSKSQRHFFGRP